MICFQATTHYKLFSIPLLRSFLIPNNTVKNPDFYQLVATTSLDTENRNWESHTFDALNHALELTFKTLIVA